MLAAMFLMAGGTKVAMSAETFAAMPNTGAMPFALVKFIGVSEVAGAIGVLIPAITRIKPMLTPMASFGLFIIMVLASLLHGSRAEWSSLGTTFVLAGIATFVTWGRWKAAPIAPR